MDIQDMRIFARVAAVQNLSAVGTELGLTPGTISKRIQALEDELHARLFDRTTRSIRITEEGSTFLLHVERILSEIEAARASVDDKVTKPKGKLKLAAPACLGRRYIAPALCEFMRRYPEIEVQVDLKDRQVNLQEEGYDVAIRTGALSDSSLIAKRLAPDRAVIVAAPSYIARMGKPQRPEDLARHDCLVLGDRWQWSFGKNGAETSVRVKGSLRSNNGEVLSHAALEGLGVIRASELEVLGEIKAGKLVVLLPDFEVSTNAAVWALYPSSKHVLPRMRVLLDFLAAWFREAKGEAARADALAASAAANGNARPETAAVVAAVKSNATSGEVRKIRARA
ncbi:MAG: LysR family transcriptional regulator [Hyphomicrobiales bacterium]|nr:MAG: LysR family transcriptional regulator [Hyphomicrobiales bacterium]